jgi:hypothetical protein
MGYEPLVFWSYLEIWTWYPLENALQVIACKFKLVSVLGMKATSLVSSTVEVPKPRVGIRPLESHSLDNSGSILFWDETLGRSDQKVLPKPKQAGQCAHVALVFLNIVHQKMHRFYTQTCGQILQEGPKNIRGGASAPTVWPSCSHHAHHRDTNAWFAALWPENTEESSVWHVWHVRRNSVTPPWQCLFLDTNFRSAKDLRTLEHLEERIWLEYGWLPKKQSKTSRCGAAFDSQYGKVIWS